MTTTKQPFINPASYLGALILTALGASALASLGSIWCGVAPLLALALYTLLRGFRQGGRDLCRHAGLAFGLAAIAVLISGATIATAPLLVWAAIASLVIGILMAGVDELLR